MAQDILAEDDKKDKFETGSTSGFQKICIKSICIFRKM